jgi:hypothetical protein
MNVALIVKEFLLSLHEPRDLFIGLNSPQYNNQITGSLPYEVMCTTCSESHSSIFITLCNFYKPIVIFYSIIFWYTLKYVTPWRVFSQTSVTIFFRLTICLLHFPHNLSLSEKKIISLLNFFRMRHFHES